MYTQSWCHAVSPVCGSGIAATCIVGTASVAKATVLTMHTQKPSWGSAVAVMVRVSLHVEGKAS
jgi:hypothetical protein